MIFIKNYIVITADIIDSKKYGITKEKLEEKLHSLNEDFSNVLTISPFRCYRGDEIQTVIDNYNYLPILIRWLRYSCRPYKLRIGVGIGAIDDNRLSTNNSWEMNGSSFHLARQSLDYIYSLEKRKKLAHTYILTNKDFLDLSINTIYSLIDVITNSWSDIQWDSVHAYEKAGTYQKASENLKLAPQTINEHCIKANWNTVNDAEKNLCALLSYL